VKQGEKKIFWVFLYLGECARVKIKNEVSVLAKKEKAKPIK